MKKIEYIEKDKTDLDLVGPLWEKLNTHHKVRSLNFAEHFDKMTWDKRKSELLDKCNNGAMLIHLAKDNKTGALIGYCVSTINDKKQAELESIYIEESYRRDGIGSNFMKRALKWMEGQAAARKVIAVAAGNEEAFPFYERYNFYPRASILEQVETKE